MFAESTNSPVAGPGIHLSISYSFLTALPLYPSSQPLVKGEKGPLPHPHESASASGVLR
jgi:hypothetical protein